MKKNLFFSLTIFVVLAISIGAQGGIASEDELKAKANELFQAQNYSDAKLMYAQLLSLYPKDPTYNYRFGACVLQTEADKTKPMKYLNFAASKANVEPLAYFYLGKAYHLNYEFAQAVKQYTRFKNKASNEEKSKYEVDRQIAMCKNGNSLLTKLNEVQVVERQSIAQKDFYRIYDQSAIRGKIIVKPEEFKSKYDKKIEDASVIFLGNDATEVYYSSYGKKGENGKDIYKSIKLGNGEWSEGVSLGNSINTKYDEDFAYMKPDGKTLYFSSKGHTSMGGYDIFRSSLDETTGQWTEPENLDFAFNSADDDYMFVTDQAEITAYFASNRANEFGEVTIYKVLTERAPAEISVISGVFIAENNPDQKKAKITVIDKLTQETVGVYETDANGKYTIEIAKNGGEYQFNVETNEVDPIHTGVVSIPNQTEFEVLGQELRLVGVGDDQQLVIKNIFDGTASEGLAASNGPRVSSSLIKMKANLDVNYSYNDLAALEKIKAEAEANNKEEAVVESSENSLTRNEEVKIEPVAIEETTEIVSEKDLKANSTISVVELEERLNSMKASKNSLIDSKQDAIKVQYAAALELNNYARAAFEEAEGMELANVESVDVDLKRKEAGEKALQASYAAQLAQDLEVSINEDLAGLNEIENAEINIQAAIGENDLATASTLLDQLKTFDENSQGTATIIDLALARNAENKMLADKKITDFSSKSQSFNEEKTSLEGQLTELNAQAKKAKGKKKQELASNIEATQLDLKDLEYQFEVLNNNLLDVKLMKKSLFVEKEEILAASGRINSNSEQVAQISEEEKVALFEELKNYREDNKLAYSSENELYESFEDDLIAAEAEIADNSTESSKENSTLDGVSNIDADEKLSNDNLVQVDLEVTDEQATYDTGTNDLQSSVSEIEVVDAEKPMSNLSINELNAKYNSEIESTELIEDKDLQLANRIQIYDDWLVDLNSSKAALNRSYEAEIDENERLRISSELETINESIKQNNRAKNDSELELAQLATGDFVADNTAIKNSNNITETSIVQDDFTSLKFDQEIQASTSQSAIELMGAKKALFEASQLSKQQKEAQESAYSLPTAEERTQAFDKANQLKKTSERKQIEAANKFAQFNLKEYQINKEAIDKANELDERYTTEGRDIAELLSEEANNFFTEAAIIRSEINESDRLTQKEVKLQKAYDYELLAIKKQQEALDKLGMVVSEVLGTKSGSSSTKKVKPFVQVIEDEAILAVVDATEAKAEAEKRSAQVITLDSEINSKAAKAGSMEEGNSKSLLLSEVEDLKVQKEQVLWEAALYYERERQINEGLVNTSSKEIAPEAQVAAFTKPAFEVALDPVNIDGERKRGVMANQEFKLFANNRQSMESQTKAAEVAYSKAIQLAEENVRLQRQAIIETNMAKVVSDEGEKQRLIKSAQVITSKIESNERQIEKLNRTIVMKNAIVQDLLKNDQSYLAQLSEIEKQEYITLSNDYVPEISTTELVKLEPETSVAEEVFAESVQSEESAEAASDLSAIEDEEPSTFFTTDGVIDESTEVLENSPEVEVQALNPEEVVETITEQPKESIASAAVEPIVKEINEPLELGNIDVIPREVKQAIFVTLNRNESAYNDNKPIPTKTSLPQGIIYKVQVGAFRNEIPASTFKGFAPLMAEPTGTGITRYTAGLFVNENTATAARDEIRKIGYPDAFVVAFLNGERISLSKARNESSPSSSVGSTTTFAKVSSGSSSTASNNTSGSNRASITQVTGGSTEALPSEFNSTEVEAVVNAATIEGVYYTIQIGVFSAPVKKGVFNYDGLNVVRLSNGLYRYNAGMFDSVIEAADLKNSIATTISDAFVTAYYNGKRITLTEASKLQNK